MPVMTSSDLYYAATILHMNWERKRLPLDIIRSFEYIIPQYTYKCVIKEYYYIYV